MDEKTFEHRLTVAEDRSLRNEGRIKKLEGEHEALHQLATSVAVMAEQLKTMNDNVDTLSEKVDALEDKPAKRWEGLLDKVLFAAAGAFVAWVASGAPGL